MPTFKHITTTTVGSSVSIVTISSLPDSSTYNDLYILIRAGNDRTTAYFFNSEMKFNASSTADYDSQTGGYGAGLGLQLFRNTSTGTLQYLYTIQGGNTNNTVMSFYIPVYSSTRFPKLIIGDIGTGGNTNDYEYRTMMGGLRNNSAAITQIQFFAGGDTWKSGSTFSLYGIKRA